MDKESLRIECSRLFMPKTIEEQTELLDVYAELYFNIVFNHQKDETDNDMDEEAKIILQMMMTKILHLKNTIKGIVFKNKSGDSLNQIIDPTIVASMIRNIFETTGMFNLIYINPKNIEQRRLIYSLWVSAGLKYRQKFENQTHTTENKEKVQSEKEQIDDIKKSIEDSAIFKSLDEKNQGKILTKLQEKDYLVEFDDKTVKFLHWHDLVRVMGIKDGLLENIYTYFSLYTHPSNVSVFQYRDMFLPGDEAYKGLTIFNLRIAYFMFSVFISDYIKLFPKTLETYNKLPIRDQIVINFQNTLCRSYDHSINDSWQLLED